MCPGIYFADEASARIAKIVGPAWPFGKSCVTANVMAFIQLAHEAIATNTEHAGIILVPSSFPTNEFRAIADAIREALKPHRAGLPGLAIYLRR